MTYLAEDLAAARNAGTIAKFASDHMACDESGGGAKLAARCSAAGDHASDGKNLVLCRIEVTNSSADSLIQVAPDSFKLVLNQSTVQHTDAYQDRILDSRLRFDSTRTVPVSETVSGLLIFDVGTTSDLSDAELVWTLEDPVHDEKAKAGLRVILFDALESETGGVLAPIADDDEAAANGTVDPAFESQTFSGSGKKVVGPIQMPKGVYRVTATYSGDGYFSLNSVEPDGYPDLLFNGDPGEAMVTLPDDSQLVFEIGGSVDWTIKIEQLMPGEE